MRHSYFLVSVSTRHNLDLCRRYCLAGFASTVNGLWAYVDIRPGDFVSFLYAARVFDLYQVTKKIAVRGAAADEPWGRIGFRSGRVYTFPFRLLLRRLRKFEEPMVRDEFATVGENLLLRGGYRKTHFQADWANLQHAVQLGEEALEDSSWVAPAEALFEPQFMLNMRAAMEESPLTWKVREPILQAAVRHRLHAGSEVGRLLGLIGVNVEAGTVECIGERGLPEGYVDLLIQVHTDARSPRLVPVEVKMGRATSADVEQLCSYMHQLAPNCPGGLLIAASVGRRVALAALEAGVVPALWRLPAQPGELVTFHQLTSRLQLEPVVT